MTASDASAWWFSVNASDMRRVERDGERCGRQTSAVDSTGYSTHTRSYGVVTLGAICSRGSYTEQLVAGFVCFINKKGLW